MHDLENIATNLVMGRTDKEIKELVRLLRAKLEDRQRRRAAVKYFAAHPERKQAA